MMKKMVTLLLYCVFAAAGLTSCAGQDFLSAQIHMNGIIGTANFTWNANNLTVSVTFSKQDTSFTSMEIRPIWLDYDVSDKCSPAQLGTPKPGLTADVSLTNNNIVAIFQGVENLDSVEGNSIVLTGPNKIVCASIEKEGTHVTAVAQFQNLIQGTVYFRQHTSPNSVTRIVTDLYSGLSSYTSPWWITDATNNYSCSQAASIPQTNGIGCGNTSQQQCPIGQLSGKLGDVTIAVNSREARQGYTDRNLPLMGSETVDRRLLLIKTPSGNACAVIRVFSKRSAVAEFSHDGITGSISFTQDSPFDPTQTVVNLKGLKIGAKGYHVHLWPTPAKVVDGQELCSATVVSGHFNPYNKNTSDPAYPPPNSSTVDNYEVGDISSKHGTLEKVYEKNATYIDWNLPLFRTNSIIGRSLVIHRDDASASRWVCTNIQPSDPAVLAVAVFKYPVIGHVYFMQAKNEPLSETSVFAQLDYNDGRPGTKNHIWEIHSDKVQHDMLSADTTSCCLSTGPMYDPHNIGQQMSETQYSSYCNNSSPLTCKVGDLSRTAGRLSIRNNANTDTSARQFFTSVNLPLSGPHSVIGRSLVIMNEQEKSILSCADIQLVRESHLVAKFSMGGISGTVSFKQNAGIGAKKTVVTNGLSGQTSDHGLWIYELPPLAASSESCSNLGAVFNPLNIAQNASIGATDDKYRVGDLSRYLNQTTWSSNNLPLTGLTSIARRSLVLLDQNNKLVACALTDIDMSDGTAQNIEAVSTFKGAVSGTIHLMQTLYGDGTMSDTSIVVELNNQDGSKSSRHNWHTHKYPVQGDAEAAASRCNSAGPHFDPFMTMTNTSNYAVECRPENPLRCEEGDQSKKLSPYDVGSGRKSFNDIDLPLVGVFSVLGRSMVLHASDQGAARLACADLIPVTGDSILVKIKTPSILNKTDVTQIYAAAIRANPWDIVVEFISQLDKQTDLRVHFVGPRAAALRQSFEDVLKGSNKNILDPYAPVIAAAYHVAVSTFLLLSVLVVQLLNYL